MSWFWFMGLILKFVAQQTTIGWFGFVQIWPEHKKWRNQTVWIGLCFFISQNCIMEAQGVPQPLGVRLALSEPLNSFIHRQPSRAYLNTQQSRPPTHKRNKGSISLAKEIISKRETNVIYSLGNIWLSRWENAVVPQVP